MTYRLDDKFWTEIWGTVQQCTVTRVLSFNYYGIKTANGIINHRWAECAMFDTKEDAIDYFGIEQEAKK